MPENILVVEYEPRYTDRVRQALQGQPITASFARDGEEAMRALDAGIPRLVVLSSVIPKGNPADLIRAIRGRSETTPILLTVSGYTGKTPEQDASRIGASDILAKPFSETEFLGKVQQLLGASAQQAARPAAPAAARRPMNATGDIDKLLADTLGGVMPKRSTTSPGTLPKPKSTADIDKLVEDTLSGHRKRTAPGAPAATPRPPEPDRVVISPPVFPQQPPAAAKESKEEDEPVDGVRFGQYVLLEKIATGGMAEVWKARKRGEEGFQKIVAIKKILPHLSDNQDFIEMFIDEAKLAAQLNHNNIIHIYDLGKIQSSYYIAMEYVDGHDLKTILKQGQERGQPLGVEIALFIASKVAAALDYAHRRRDFNQQEMGLVHRDVSPQNVLISHEGDIKLCDFGIAKAASKASHTQAGALKGKLQYMSPEQAWGRHVDRRSDIFALGVVLYEMLAGTKLFTGENEMSILEQVREARVTPPSEVNDEVTPEIDAIVLKALQKDPAARYQTAGEMTKDIDSVLYSLRPTPTSADLAIYMHRIWAPEPAAPALHDEPTVIQQAPAPPPPASRAAAAAAPAAAKPVTSPGVAMPAWDAPPAKPVAEKKRSAAAPLLIVAVIVAGIVGAYVYLRGLPTPMLPGTGAVTETLEPVAQSEAPPVGTTPAETGTLVPLPTETTNTIPPSIGTTAEPPPLDPALVDLEVQRLLAAERARLEQEALARQREQTATVAPPPARVPPPQPQPQVATQPPPPREEPARPAPAPPSTGQNATESRPEPQPPAAQAAPAERRWREGDLVPPGTEGLTPARVVRYGSVAYPAMARAQRVEGTVLLNVLVSETGEVLDVRLLRGVGRPVGLDQAAEQVIRRSTFAPPTMSDGTRVKAWTAVPVRFAL